MTKQGWLVNDCLTCIPGTETLWHDLLRWIPGLVDKTGGYTNFQALPITIEAAAELDTPDFIIRNASYFRQMSVDCKTISLMQDPLRTSDQIKVCNNSDVVVFNSEYMKDSCKNLIDPKRSEVIPLGVNFDFFCDLENDFSEELGIPENAILFIGADNHFKGFDKVRWLIDNTSLNFCLVMKDDVSINNDRCKTFNSVDHETLRKIINSCSACLCTSTIETQHLSSIEAGACNIPVVTTNVGIHYNKNGDGWGEKIPDGASGKDIAELLEKALSSEYQTRDKFIEFKYNRKSCKEKWVKLCKE
jgi:glycosyltransferase involved in cell wall biosynthesis